MQKGLDRLTMTYVGFLPAQSLIRLIQSPTHAHLDATYSHIAASIILNIFDLVMMNHITKRSIATIGIAFLVAGGNAFVPPAGVTSAGGSHPSTSAQLLPSFNNNNIPTSTSQQQSHVALRRQRRSVASVQMQGLFGLGAPEIAIILVAVAFVLGPQKLAELGKDAGKMAGEYGKELKNVPEEFKKGYDETQSDIRAKKAKEMDPVPKEIEGSE